MTIGKTLLLPYILLEYLQAMKTSCSLNSLSTQPSHRCGFTLTELAVVIAVVGMLSILCLTAMAGAKGQSKIAVCADNIRQLVDGSQIYANENQGVLPGLNPPGSAAWAWDLPMAPAQALLNIGLQKKNFYCPSTEPRFTDWQNWQEPGQGNNLWDYSTNPVTGLHIVGYTLAYWGSLSRLSPTNQNRTMQTELINYGGTYLAVPNAQRVLVADVILSAGNVQPGYLHPENNYISIAGGFSQPGHNPYPHLSAHLNGAIPAGHNLGFKDGHVEWQPFDATVVPRTGYDQPSFWW